MNAKLYIVNVEAAIYKQDKWLMAKRSETEDHAPGELSLIGGKVEVVNPENHVLEKTLAREVMEEVGVLVEDDMQYVKSCSFISDSGEIVIDIVFLCRYKSGEPTVLEPEELTTVGWMGLDEILSDEKIQIWTKESLRKAESIRKSS